MKTTSSGFSNARNAHVISVMQVLLFLAGCAVVLIIVSVLPLPPSGAVSMLLSALIALSVTFALAHVFAFWTGMSPQMAGMVFQRASIWRLLCGFATGTLILLAQCALMRASGHISWEFAHAPDWQTVLAAILAFLLLAAREEVAFHGFALRRLYDCFGLWPAQIVIAAIFALEHIAGGYSLLNAFAGAALGSLLFGMAALATRGLAVPVGIHAAWNIGDWLRGGKTMPGILQPVTESGYETFVQTSGLLSYMLTMALAAAGFWLWYRYRLTQEASA